mmetsp:Transcript_26937/g.58840  ORF Transcript_26937/g.58840 Transcript_26937/m.58840 type:complete len:212 (+) Transcript_26937:552-1187(+)
MLKQGRVSMATGSHHLVDMLLRQQIVSEEAATKASATVDKLGTTMGQHGGWVTNEDFGVEAEVNHAVETHYMSLGVESVEELPMFKVILGPNGKRAYSFDGVFEVSCGAQKLLVLVECKRRVSKEDVEDSAKKRDQLVQLMHGIRDKTTPPKGRHNYLVQLKFLSEYCAHDVRLCIGGQSFDEDGMEYAIKEGCLVAQPDGGRYSCHPLQL